jgi:hypothetical protein
MKLISRVSVDAIFSFLEATVTGSAYILPNVSFEHSQSIACCHALKTCEFRKFLKLFYFSVAFILPCIIYVLLIALVTESI